MTLPESEAPDRPFPGARSQVPGVRHPELSEPAGGREALPLDVSPQPAGEGWQLRVPLRAEQVTVSKQVVVRERVAIARRRVGETQDIDVTVRRERLRVEPEGELDIARGETAEDITVRGRGAR